MSVIEPIMGVPTSMAVKRMPVKPPLGSGVLERIGNTPLLQVNRTRRPGISWRRLLRR